MTDRTTVVLFTRDLRVHDNPVLAEAAAAGPVLPLFVLDDRVPSSEFRQRFLLESLVDLRESLRARGADLFIRRGDPATEAVRLAQQHGATAVACADDVSRYAGRRRRRLERAAADHRLAVLIGPGTTILPAGAIRPATGGDHYKIFTPYYRVWLARPWRELAPLRRKINLPPGVHGDDPGTVLTASPRPEQVAAGGETAGRARLAAWRAAAPRYAELHDDMAGDGTSRLSPYLHFGCVSAREAAAAFADQDAFVRQLCWRDFYHQLLASFPDLATRPYRASAKDDWGDDAALVKDWQAGETGMPIVDAGMRQLAAEGWMHNRARLITAGYLVKKLGQDWRAGLAWFGHLLLDADVANNAGNWQWMAGTGTDARPQRGFNPVRQAHRYDPDGEYVRRYVPELADIAGGAVHEPWKLSRSPRGYRRLDGEQLSLY